MQVLAFQIHKVGQSSNYPPKKSIPSSISISFPDSNPSTSISTSNLKIQSLSNQGNLSKALHLLSSEPAPSQRTYELLLLACARNNVLSLVHLLHRHLHSHGYDQDPFLATKLIDAYSSLDSLADARKVFDQISHKTSFVYGAFFRALSLAGEGTQVLALYRRTNHSGIASDRFIFNYALKACAAADSSVSMLIKVKEIHSRILKEAHEHQLHCITTLLDVYARFGCLTYARKVFDRMPTRSVVTFSAMISSCVKNEKPYEGLTLFKNMIAEKADISPSPVTMVSVVQSCASLVALEQGKAIHGYVVRHGLDTILPISNALITMYARCGRLDLAQTIFDQMKRKDAVTWNSLISSYGIHGDGEKAVEIFNRMVGEGIEPTVVSFVSVLGACSHAGLVEEGNRIFWSMKKEHGVNPSVEHYACMVDLLGRANRVKEAAEMVWSMRMEPGGKVWGALLGSCRIHTNVEVADWASKRLFEMEATNAGNYVALAEIYAAAGKKEEVKRIKGEMEKKGLRKVGGMSWIEVMGRTHKLETVDEMNPQMEQLHALLMNLVREMREIGYRPLTKGVLYDLEEDEKEAIVLGHSEKLAIAFGLINSAKGTPIRISKNLRLCEDCHSFTKYVSKFTGRTFVVRDVNRIHIFRDGYCSCQDYW